MTTIEKIQARFMAAFVPVVLTCDSLARRLDATRRARRCDSASLGQKTGIAGPPGRRRPRRGGVPRFRLREPQNALRSARRQRIAGPRIESPIKSKEGPWSSRFAPAIAIADSDPREDWNFRA